MRLNITIAAILYSSDGDSYSYSSENEIQIVEEININKKNITLPLTILVVAAIMAIMPQKAYASYLLLNKSSFRDNDSEYPTLGKYLASFLDRKEWSNSIKYQKISRYTGHLVDFGLGVGITYIAGKTHLGLQEGLKNCQNELVKRNLEILSQNSFLKHYRLENAFLKTRECLSVVSCETVHDSLLPQVIESVIIDLD